MNYLNNFNQNNFDDQGKQNQKKVFPIPYRNTRSISPIELKNNINDNIANRTVKGFYPKMNMPFYQGQNIIYDNKLSKENKPISRNTNTLGRINYEAKTDIMYNNLNSPKRQINNNYLKYIKNTNSNIFDEDNRGRPIYYEYIPSKLKMKNFLKKIL
jgi:hypothetical protein